MQSIEEASELTERVNQTPLEEIFRKLFTSAPDFIEGALRQGASAGPHYRNFLEETRAFLAERIGQSATPEKREMLLRLWREYEMRAYGRVLEEYPPAGLITAEALPQPTAPRERPKPARLWFLPN